jgi:thiamine-monophosphate kinase
VSEADGASLGSVGEFGLIDRITTDIRAFPAVLLGPGDDTAIVAAPFGSVLVTTDVLVEGHHFRRDWSTAVDIGRKAAAASLADIAAMGGVPTALVVGFGAPSDLPASWAVSCSAGLAQEAASMGAAIVGGDVVAAEQIIVSVTALGDLQGRSAVLRSGARPGDVLALAGRVGWAAAGLAILTAGFRSPKVLVDAHRFPEPPYGAGPIAAVAGASAMIDVSDGLIADARHIAEASGVVLDIQTEFLALPEALRSTASAFGIDPLQWVLTGGEDHPLLATFPPDRSVPADFTVIGAVRDGQGKPGVAVDGESASDPGGFDHFR